jgi:hypothetical protein
MSAVCVCILLQCRLPLLPAGDFGTIPRSMSGRKDAYLPRRLYRFFLKIVPLFSKTQNPNQKPLETTPIPYTLYPIPESLF